MIDILKELHKKLSNLEISDLKNVYWALGYKNTFQQLALLTFDPEEETLFEFLLNLKICESNSELKTLIKQNGIKINNEKITIYENIKWLKIKHIEFAIIKKGKNDFYLMFKEI